MTQSLTLDFLIRGICMMRGDLFLKSHCSPPLKSMAHCFWPMNYLYSNYMSHGKEVWLWGGDDQQEGGNLSLAWDPSSGCRDRLGKGCSASQSPNEAGTTKNFQPRVSPPSRYTIPHQQRHPKSYPNWKHYLLLGQQRKTQDPIAQREVTQRYER